MSSLKNLCAQLRKHQHDARPFVFSLMSGLLFSRRNVPRSLITPHPAPILGHQDTLAFEEENPSRTFAFHRPHLICIPGTGPAADQCHG
ncbi:hypothetical protein TNCT_641901 [Trichonephila clavata]|uniref:Uncharacterized protein n=1 Tax=Trichonephila clavata TaxID=2740835 RepID=A0A8X6M526_TRICU|nr:hypothetical protein TNCT_641901 [Trichonephila clavata]